MGLPDESTRVWLLKPLILWTFESSLIDKRLMFLEKDCDGRLNQVSTWQGSVLPLDYHRTIEMTD